MPCSRVSSWPGIKLASLWSPASAGGFFTTSTTWETYIYVLHLFVCFIFVFAGSFIAVFRLSLVSESRVYSPVIGVSLHWLLLLGGTGSSCWGALALGVWASVTAAGGPRACRPQEVWGTGFTVRRHMESSRIAAHTCVLCVGRQILIHSATREVLIYFVFLFSHLLFKSLKGFVFSGSFITASGDSIANFQESHFPPLWVEL